LERLSILTVSTNIYVSPPSLGTAPLVTASTAAAAASSSGLAPLASQPWEARGASRTPASTTTATNALGLKLEGFNICDLYSSKLFVIRKAFLRNTAGNIWAIPPAET
jgi:hypothetical protein